MGRFLKEITHLAEMGHYKLANKMINMAKTGKTFKLSNKELEAFNVVKNSNSPVCDPPPTSDATKFILGIVLKPEILDCTENIVPVD